MLSVKATFSAVILAAGNSSRMERPKHLLKFDESHNFLEIIASSFLDFGSAEVIVVLNEDNYNDMKKREMRDGVVCVLNSEPVNGRFSSLQVGLRSLSNHGPVFVHNVDNPFVKRETLLRLTQMLGEYDYIKPMFNGLGGHPFLISSNVVGSILERSQPDSASEGFSE